MSVILTDKIQPRTTGIAVTVVGDMDVTGAVSVAGTITYEDVTNIDSVGLITARAGVNVSGGQLLVGSGITMGIAGVATFSGTADIHLTDGVKLLVGDAGSSDASLYHAGGNTYLANATGNLVLGSGGSDTTIKISPVNGEEGIVVTPNTSVDLYYNNSKKFETTNDGTVTTGIGTFTAGATFGDDVEFQGASANITFDKSADDLIFMDNAKAVFGTGGDLEIYASGSTSIIDSTNQNIDIQSSGVINIKPGDASGIIAWNGAQVDLYYNASKKFETTNDGTVTTGIATVISTGVVNAMMIKGTGSHELYSYHDNGGAGWATGAGAGNYGELIYMDESNGNVHIYAEGEQCAKFAGNSSVDLFYNNVKKFETTNDGVVVSGMTTSVGVAYTGLLRESFAKTDGRLSANTNIDLEKGMVHYFTTAENTTSTPNIRWNSSISLNNKMNINDAITVTIISAAAAAGYSAQMTIDGGGISEQWVGGEAPDEGGANGYDIYTYNILKTADATFFVIAHVVNAT